MIKKLFQAANKERPVAALLYIVRKVFDWTRGRVMAKILGWPESYLGPGSKVLGTLAIKVDGSAYINRYAWIEAVHNFGDQSFEPSISIGRGIAVSDRFHVSAINRIEIGDNCLIGSGVLITDHNHGAYRGGAQSIPLEPPVRRMLVSHGPVIIGKNVWLGDNVVIIGPVRIGDGVVVGANSLVTKDIPDGVIAGGVPARILKKFDPKTAQWEPVEQ